MIRALLLAVALCPVAIHVAAKGITQAAHDQIQAEVARW